MASVVQSLTRELPEAAALEVARLQKDGYVIHKEWLNGVELRKGKPFREWVLALHILLVVLLPAFASILLVRSIANNLFGFKHRVLVSLAPNEGELFFS